MVLPKCGGIIRLGLCGKEGCSHPQQTHFTAPHTFNWLRLSKDGKFKYEIGYGPLRLKRSELLPSKPLGQHGVHGQACAGGSWLQIWRVTHEFGIVFLSSPRYQTNEKTFKELVGFWINNLSMRVPNSVVLPVGTHVDCCEEEEVEEKRHDIMTKISAMLAERKRNLAHFINNLEGSEEPEIYVDQWEKLKEMESRTLKVRLRL